MEEDSKVFKYSVCNILYKLSIISLFTIGNLMPVMKINFFKIVKVAILHKKFSLMFGILFGMKILNNPPYWY